ncbi:MAG: type II secretion system protein [Candidatus Omnitrophica bacterium]|nr:type II secretion system protein [Candidatus Omnitrophota bacterium]MDD5429798.1 type II secretion system protein [Candidatus Omnitrophota bacterium]
MQIKKKSGVLIEVLVGAIVLTVVSGTLLLSFISARRYINNANKLLIAANLDRSVLNNLYKEVRQDTWDDSQPESMDGTPIGLLYAPIDSSQVHNLPDYAIENVEYKGNNYTVKSVPGKDYREVSITINYPLE